MLQKILVLRALDQLLLTGGFGFEVVVRWGLTVFEKKLGRQKISIGTGLIKFVIRCFC